MCILLGCKETNVVGGATSTSGMFRRSLLKSSMGRAGCFGITTEIVILAVVPADLGLTGDVPNLTHRANQYKTVIAEMRGYHH